MRIKGIFSALCIVTMLLSSASGAFAVDLIINEIMFNPDGDENAREYVELHNTGDTEISLEGFQIGDGSAVDDIVLIPDGDWNLSAGEYAIIIDPDYFTKDEPYRDIIENISGELNLFTVADKAIGSRGLSNSTAETVTIISALGDTLDAVTYDIDCTPGHSWERVSPDETLFHESYKVDGSPGLSNSVVQGSSTSNGMIILNEIMAAPETGEPEWIELLNISDIEVSLYGWSVVDSGGGTARIDKQLVIESGGFVLLGSGQYPHVLPGDNVFFELDGMPALNNDGDMVRILDHSGAVVDSMRYEGTESGISLERLSPDSSKWAASADPSGSTPGAVNSIAFDREVGERSAKLSVDPNPFGDVTRISYQLDFPLARVNLSVYDRRGRLLLKLRDGEESGSEWSTEWNAVVGGARLSAGPYILRLEALNKETGRMTTLSKTIVAGSRL